MPNGTHANLRFAKTSFILEPLSQMYSEEKENGDTLYFPYFSGMGQLSPAALALLNYSATLLRATFKLRPICRAYNPQSRLNRMISLIPRIGNLSAGI
jgi:hypothetical protein